MSEEDSPGAETASVPHLKLLPFWPTDLYVLFTQVEAEFST